MSRKLYLTNEDIHSYKHFIETLLICQSYFSLHINKYYKFGKQYFPLKTVLFMPGWIRSGHEGWGRGWMFHFSCAVNLLPIQTCQCNVAKVLVNCPNPIRLVGVMERYLPKSVKISDKSCYVDRASNIANLRAKHNKTTAHCLSKNTFMLLNKTLMVLLHLIAYFITIQRGLWLLTFVHRRLQKRIWCTDSVWR